MTLISMINGYGRPLIISDRAISEKGTLHAVTLPTTNSKTFRPTPVVDFNVKTLILQEILCVAFAGNVSVLEETHRDIADFFLHRTISSTTLNEFLGSMDYNSGCSFLFAMGGPEFPDQPFILKIGSWTEDQSREGINVLSCGSGAVDWSSYLVNSLRYDTNNNHSVESCFQNVLSSCIAFINLERKTTLNLMDGWGGGFDIVHFEEGKFHRFDDVTYIFYKFDITKPGAPNPLSLIHNSYKDGAVIVRHLTSKGFGIYHIPQFNNKIPLSEEDPNCISRNVISCIHLFEGKQFHSDLCVQFWDLDPNAEPAIFTTRKNGGFGVEFRKAYIDNIKEAIKLYIT